MLPAAMLLAAACIPLLVWYAADAILNSSDGELTQRTTDPTAPGYEVLVLPSPSHMVLSLDPAGELASVTLLSLASNDRGGTALFIPAETLVEPDLRLVDVFGADGAAATRRAVAELININTDDANLLDENGWAGVTAPAAPVPVDNPDDLSTPPPSDDAPGTVVYPAGNVSIEADQAAEYMGWVNGGEARARRLDRQIAFWDAWVTIIAASSDPTTIPGERDSGLGRMLAGLANGPAILEPVMGEEILLDDGRPAIRVDVPALRARVVQMIPFPLPVEPGARPRVRLLDGVGGLDVASDYSRGLVVAGAQITIIGNAPSFGTERTQVVYHDKRFEKQAESFSKTLGGASVQFEPLDDAVLDVTIVIGEDLAGTSQ